MTKPIVESYLFFGGKCEEAVAFYCETLGAEVEMMMRFRESPEAPPPGAVPDGFDDKIMHCAFRIGESLVMASDGCEETSKFGGFSLSLTVATVEEANRVFSTLAEGGEITMPIGETFWSPCFGSVTDRYGLSWMVGIPGEQ